MVAIQAVVSMVCAIAESVGTSLYIKGIVFCMTGTMRFCAMAL